MAVEIVPTAEELREARAWLADCVWADMDADLIGDLEPRVVVGGVDRHYVGGWTAFSETCQGTW